MSKRFLFGSRTNCYSPFSSKNIQECRCGTPSCRGVLGPTPKDKDIKDVIKPLIQGGTRRKLQDAFDTARGAMQSVVGKRRRAQLPAPKSPKKTMSITGDQPRSRLISGKSPNGILAGKVLSKTHRAAPKPRGMKGGTAVASKRRTQQNTATTKAPIRSYRSGSRFAAASVRRRVVRTAKGTNCGDSDRQSIRVVS